MAYQADSLAYLSKHDCIQWPTALPFFRGMAPKDLMIAKDWMDHFKGAAKIAKWKTNKCKITEFRLLIELL